MAIRLDRNHKTIEKVRTGKSKEELIKWVQERDPDNIGWTYRKEKKKAFYYPIEETSKELLDKLKVWTVENGIK